MGLCYLFNQPFIKDLIVLKRVIRKEGLDSGNKRAGKAVSVVQTPYSTVKLCF